jgi:glycine hydroxymethyltransferase
LCVYSDAGWPDQNRTAPRQREDERQASTIILIASESDVARRRARSDAASNFANIYAEGYPREESRRQTEDEILDTTWSWPTTGAQRPALLQRRRIRRSCWKRWPAAAPPNCLPPTASRRPALRQRAAAQRRAGQQRRLHRPAPAGRHHHGPESQRRRPSFTRHAHQSLRQGYNGVTYFVDETTELLDYDAIEKHWPWKQNRKSSSPATRPIRCIIDWQRFREIADKVGAYLLADISHISGLVAAGVHPSPIGIADVVMTTTHKSLCGPRGAMIMTHRPTLAAKSTGPSFPGEQGGPHLNTMAALAVALKLAKTDQFRAYSSALCQMPNALAAKTARARPAHRRRRLGKPFAAGGYQKRQHNGVPLSGDMAARILDVAEALSLNRNTIPGDKGAFNPTGVRLGTVWISQLGFGDAEVDLLAEAIATV